MSDFDDLHIWLLDFTGALLCLLVPALLWLVVSL